MCTTCNSAQAVHSLCMQAFLAVEITEPLCMVVAGTENVTGLEKHLFHSIPFHCSIPFLSFLARQKLCCDGVIVNIVRP